MWWGLWAKGAYTTPTAATAIIIISRPTVILQTFATRVTGIIAIIGATNRPLNARLSLHEGGVFVILNYLMDWYRKTTSEIFEVFKTSDRGLSLAQAAIRLKECGPNVLPEEKIKSLSAIFFSQFGSPLVYILLIAAIAVVFIGETIDALVIAAALFINAFVGTVQEGRAQGKLAALKKFSETNALVFREGRERIIPDRELTPGDLILLREGDKVPADARLISDNALRVDEAAITGESESVSKNSGPIAKTHISLGDQLNMVFKGTLVVGGQGKAVVVATGLGTIVGNIASKLTSVDAGMPIKKDIDYLSRVILITTLLIVALIFAIGILKGFSVREMFSTAVAIAVSAIPEGLPVVVTLVLATGVARMSSRNALVKRLQAVEALGQAKVIAVDKTGTITRNQMMVSRVFAGGKLFEVTGAGYEPQGSFLFEDVAVDPLNHSELLMLGRTSLLTATARIAFLEGAGEWERISGDPTEAAVLSFAGKLGFEYEKFSRELPRLFEIPFESRLKFHASINMIEGKPLLSIAGAPEVILSHCNEIWREGQARAMTDDDRQLLASSLRKFSREGLRVIAVAANFHGLHSIKPDALPSLCSVGLLGIIDAIRPEVPDAVNQARAAGMKVVMITGDYADTAEAIARKAGIFKDGNRVLLGEEIEKYSVAELAGHLAHVTVFARVSPEHKLKIIEAYRFRGEIIAMTGDGVNDALSLSAADLGVAMGKIGTEVAKEAADIVLLDDNFSSIVAAVEEGRNIYRTIRKVLLYLFSTSLGEIFAITITIMLGYPLLLTPSQIIWLNLVTDGFLVVALALEPKEKNLLSRGYRTVKGFLIDLVGLERIFLMASVMTLGTIILFDQYVTIDPAKAGTVALTMLAVFQWFNAWNCRSTGISLFASSFRDNIFLISATVAVAALQLTALHLPFFQRILHTTPLTFAEWMTIIAAGLLIVMAEELRKVFYRTRLRTKGKVSP